MKAIYDPEEKQLVIIASNPDEQDELEGLAGVMRHGDHAFLMYEAAEHAVTIGGDSINRRWGQPLRFIVAGANEEVVSNCVDEVYNAVLGDRSFSFFWAGEIPEDGWNTLVFGHI